MQGVGELFGSSFDDVLRRPAPALVPLIVDVTLLLSGALVFSAALGVVVFAGPPHALPSMPLAVPEALPSVTSLHDASALAFFAGARGFLALATLVLVAVPLLAFAEGGFIGVLAEAYLPRDPLEEREESLSAIRDAFLREGRAAFGALLALRMLQVALAAAAVLLPAYFPYFGSSFFGLVAFDFFFLFAPYVAVLERRSALASLRKSFRTVSDYLASSLVALLFGLLTMGGLAALLVPVLRVAGPAGALAGAVVVAPVGTVLSLFYLKVYLSFHPAERYPAAALPARDVATVPADA